jgi:hypothetical protein
MFTKGRIAVAAVAVAVAVSAIAVVSSPLWSQSAHDSHAAAHDAASHAAHDRSHAAPQAAFPTASPDQNGSVVFGGSPGPVFEHRHEVMAATASNNVTESTKAYVEAMERMHSAMMGMAYSGDADIDFARGMIPHHQAAIDMAVILLENGENEELRLLAQEIIDAQEREIAQLEAWLSQNDPDR